MAAGLFGKLPAKRDFIEYSVDRALMEKWDPWLQQAVATSRELLGQDWLDIYLRAPIWRFWLGSGICGKPVLGVLMPSVDGVGRYFPLSLVWCGEGEIPPPELDEQADWFAAAEEVLLGALGDGVRYEGVQAALALLPPVRREAAAPDQSIPGLFRALRGGSLPEFYRTRSCWWVPSHDGGATPARTMLRHGLPAPPDYATMLTGERNGQMAEVAGDD
jgi:type VI secretion system protein ImpM